jgi:hypothetical protein
VDPLFPEEDAMFRKSMQRALGLSFGVAFGAHLCTENPSPPDGSMSEPARTHGNALSWEVLVSARTDSPGASFMETIRRE